jgi:hypothetical protein
MNKKMFWKPSVDDIQNEGCDEEELEMLCDIFESRMREMACTSLRKGWYHLEDSAYAKEHELDGFTLTMEKYPHAGVEQWIGIFEAKGKRLRLFGMLDPET